MFLWRKTCNMFQNLAKYFDFSKKISKKLATHHHKSCCLGQNLQNELSCVASFDKKWKHVTCFQKHVTCFHQIPFFPTAEDKNKFSNVLPDRFGYYGAIIIQNITILTWVVKKKFSSRSGNKWSPPLSLDRLAKIFKKIWSDDFQNWWSVDLFLWVCWRPSWIGY